MSGSRSRTRTPTLRRTPASEAATQTATLRRTPAWAPATQTAKQAGMATVGQPRARMPTGSAPPGPLQTRALVLTATPATPRTAFRSSPPTLRPRVRPSKCSAPACPHPRQAPRRRAPRTGPPAPALPVAPLQDLRRAPLQDLRRAPLQDLRRAPLQDLRRAPLQDLRRAPPRVPGAVPMVDGEGVDSAEQSAGGRHTRGRAG